jgi:hypothetical protein
MIREKKRAITQKKMIENLTARFKEMITHIDKYQLSRVYEAVYYSLVQEELIEDFDKTVPGYYFQNMYKNDVKIDQKGLFFDKNT